MTDVEITYTIAVCSSKGSVTCDIAGRAAAYVPGTLARRCMVTIGIKV